MRVNILRKLVWESNRYAIEIVDVKNKTRGTISPIHSNKANAHPPNAHPCMHATNTFNRHQISNLTYAQQTNIGKLPPINKPHLSNHPKLHMETKTSRLHPTIRYLQYLPNKRIDNPSRLALEHNRTQHMLQQV